MKDAMTHSKVESPNHRKTKTEQFFTELEEEIVQQLRVEASSPEGRAELCRSAGIHDTVLLGELVQLGVTADIYTRNSARCRKSRQRRLIEFTEKQMLEVAKASGGHFGFGKVSTEEQKTIDLVVSTMREQMLMK